MSAPGATFEPGESVRDIRIVSPGALEISLLPVLAAILRSRAPHWSLTIEPFERRSYEIDLATGRVDFVLSVGGATPIGALVDAAIVWEDELVVLAGPALGAPCRFRSHFDRALPGAATHLSASLADVTELPRCGTGASWKAPQNCLLRAELCRPGACARGYGSDRIDAGPFRPSADLSPS